MPRTVLTAPPLTACLASVASATTTTRTLKNRARVTLPATPSGCENNPGPWITLNGELKLGGVNAKIILSNNEKGTHSNYANVVANVALIPAGESIKIAKQPSRGGVGGNPWIYFQFTDGYGSSLTSPVRLGRCVQGLTNVSGLLGIPSGMSCDIDGGGCDNSGGPFVTLNGEIRLGGLNGRIILTNNAKFTHATSEDVVLDVVLLEEGKSITFAKQPPLDGVTGNPLVYVQFTTSSGESLGSPILLGRCVQL